MDIEQITQADIKDLIPLQPEGWPDLETSFKFYIENTNCYPFKYMMDDNMMGIGTMICYGSTSWLAHIIVVENFRNQGLGKKIVLHLIDEAKKQRLESVLLIATELGYPVYLKTGFVKQSQYLFFERKNPTETKVQTKVPSPHIKPYDKRFENDIYSMDYRISGENRKWLLKDHLEKSYLYIKEDKLKGYYLKSLHEGLIIAATPEVGIELLKLKCNKSKKVVLPQENTKGIAFLKKNGFSQKLTVARMVWGKSIQFKPEQLYSRIAGNFG